MTGSAVITVTANLPVSVTIAASANPVVLGTVVTFTATPVNGGTTPSYQWLVNGLPVGAGLPTYAYPPSNGDAVTCMLTSNATCITGNPATSNTVVMTVTGPPVNLAVDGTVSGTKCYNATEIITVAELAAFTVTTTGHVEMIAGVAIRYKPGTTVASGGYMWGHIAPGGPWCIPAATLPIAATTAGEDELPVPAQKSSFKIYPNPTTGNFTLEQSGVPRNGILKVVVYGMFGEKMLTKELTGSNKYEFSISEFPVGLYFVKVVAGEDVETVKLIKTN